MRKHPIPRPLSPRRILNRQQHRPTHNERQAESHLGDLLGHFGTGELAFFPLWSYAHPQAAALAERLADAAPGDLNRVFFTTGGGEAVETAWKLARQYFKAVGKPLKHKAISRSIAYHGTTMGALSLTGIPSIKEEFEPLVPSTMSFCSTLVSRPDSVDFIGRNVVL